ncbi:hypothetical protein SFOMI_4707 [Sphingobium fuliginis]|uniref:Uncharacterized protein n=1 Tax=Sphingobium fuliginis (strain ATCC 27551) TaxID=336203 RepID=A0A292ZML7_SPHSA|nr:hypothetical protein SFOMI_4707 [Sphingobium fuliginis]
MGVFRTVSLRRDAVTMISPRLCEDRSCAGLAVVAAGSLAGCAGDMSA